MELRSHIDKASVLAEALPYIQAFRGKTVVVKYGGSTLAPEGGADTVVNALLEAVGSKGTLLMPSFNHRAAQVYNRMATPTTNGAIPDAFWRHPGAVRSEHPTHAVAALGPRAERYCASHLEAGIWEADSPIGQLVHGGGWILGRPHMSDLGNEDMAKRHGLAVLSVDYRLAPEHPYPAGPDDCEAAAAWLLEHGPERWGTDKMFIGGESAGGHLAAATLLRVRDRLGAIDRVLGANLVFGWYDLRGTPSIFGNGGHPDMLNPPGLQFMIESFTPGMSDAERRDPDVSPLFADLSGLPSCLVSVGTFDHLLDDSLFFATRLAAAESPVELAVYPDSPHGFMALPSEMAKTHATRLNSWISSLLP